MKCYCVKCRAPTEIDDEATKIITNKRGGQMRQGLCPKCGATCNTFLSKPPGERKVINKKRKVTPPVVVGPPLEPTHTQGDLSILKRRPFKIQAAALGFWLSRPFVAFWGHFV